MAVLKHALLHVSGNAEILVPVVVRLVLILVFMFVERLAPLVLMLQSRKTFNYDIMKKEKHDLISRRDFFKKVSSKALPFLALTVASSPILSVTANAAAKAPSGCYIGTCMGTCYTGCMMSCNTSCLNGCYTSCVSQCAMMCNSGCHGGCNDTCAQGCSSCVAECRLGCGKGCSGTCIANCASYSEHPAYD